FVLQNTPEIPELQLPGLTLSKRGYKHETSQFDLTLSITETNECLHGTVEYCTDLYSSGTVFQMMGHFVQLLKSIVAEPEQKIGNLQMLSVIDEHRLLVEFNGDNGEQLTTRTIVDLFEEQVQKTPDAVALIYDDQQLNYQQLNGKVNQLAHYLRVKGVKEETLVPVCIERGVEMIVSILSVLKAGGAYVPIDPNYPSERIVYMLEDTAASIMISSKAAKIKLSACTEVEIVDVDKDSELISGQQTSNLSIPTAPHQLAYVIYTSGSTGKPKGVLIEHANVYAFIAWSQKEFSSSPFSIVYATTSICFDLSIFEIIYPLTIGKKIRIIENGLQIPTYLPADSSVLINTVPSVVESLLREGTDLSHITVINMAGEPIPNHVLQGLDTDRIEVRNLYGPTEDTTYSTVHRFKRDEPILIGKPVTNTYVQITDKEGQLVPVGVPGEIHLGGAEVARGYLNNQELTEERFIKNEFYKKQLQYSNHQNLLDLFARQVAKTPYATAVIFNLEQLSYCELNEQSNRLAHYLRAKGVKEETLVPICIERGIEMIIGLLGILKAGGAYVPVDPFYP
ncbi:MAG: AMP-binding protein, partial [Segetibacter sp.]